MRDLLAHCLKKLEITTYFSEYQCLIEGIHPLTYILYGFGLLHNSIKHHLALDHLLFCACLMTPSRLERMRRPGADLSHQSDFKSGNLCNIHLQTR